MHSPSRSTSGRRLGLISPAIATLVLRHDRSFLLGLVHHDLVRHWQCTTHLALWVVAKHDLDFDTEHTLPHQHVPDCLADVVLLGLTGGNEVAVFELHGLGALRAQLTTDDDLTARRSVLHDEAHNAVASPAHGEATEELVPQGLRLGHGAGRTILNAF